MMIKLTRIPVADFPYGALIKMLQLASEKFLRVRP